MPHSAKMSALKAEYHANPSAQTGAPKIGLEMQKKTTVEQCRRVCSVEAHHVGAATVETQIGNTSARRLWAVCGECERRVRFLYQPVDDALWKCAKCHSLTTKSRQQHKTKAEFAAWLTPARYSRMAAKHPAMKLFYEETGADFRANVAPLDCSKISDEQRAQLLKFYADDAAIKRAFECALMNWSERFEERAQTVGDEIRADLWRWWKSRSRPR